MLLHTLLGDLYIIVSAVLISLDSRTCPLDPSQDAPLLHHLPTVS